MLGRKRLGLLAILFVFSVGAIPALAVADNSDPFDMGGFREATITLSRTPEPPLCATPDDSVRISWTITYGTTPQKVVYTMTDANGDTVETQTYPGATGVTVTRWYDVPVSPVEGTYWAHIEYWSMEGGNEANAEVAFWICDFAGSICATKFQDLDCDGEVTGADGPLQGWWICIVTPGGQTFCQQTGADGKTCWETLPLGTYKVYEPPVAGWIPITGGPYFVTLTEGDPDRSVFFFNQNYDDCYGACCDCYGKCYDVTEIECLTNPDIIKGRFTKGVHCKDFECDAPSATEKSTWGQVKDSYRQ